MDLFPEGRLAPDPGELVHRETLVGRVFVLAVFALSGCAWLALPLVAGPWGFAAWPIGLLILGCVAAMVPGVLRGFRGAHWAVRLRPSGIALRVRSYMNDDLSHEDATVCWIPVGEIRCVRPGRNDQLLPGSRRDLQVADRHLDIQLAHGDTEALARALAHERQSPRRGRAHHHVYPVRLVAPDLVRVTFGGQHIALRPSLEQALAFLERHYTVEPALEQRVDWRELSDEQAAELARELAQKGSRMEAVRLLRLRGGLGLARARELVDELAA